MGGVEERPAKGFRASGKAMEEARRYRQSLLGFPYAHEGLGNRHTAAASRKQAACQGDTCRMASVPVGGGAAVRYPLKTRMNDARRDNSASSGMITSTKTELQIPQ